MQRCGFVSFIVKGRRTRHSAAEPEPAQMKDVSFVSGLWEPLEFNSSTTVINRRRVFTVLVRVLAGLW